MTSLRSARPLPPVVTWYRMSEGRQLVRALLVGAPFVLLGDLLVAVAVVLNGRGLALQLSVLALGLIATATGPGYVIWKLRKLWSDDRYLALHTDGVRYHGSEHQWFASWDDVDEIRLDAEGVPALQLHDGTVRTLLGTFSGAGPGDVVEALKTVQRKAVFGLYKR